MSVEQQVSENTAALNKIIQDAKEANQLDPIGQALVDSDIFVVRVNANGKSVFLTGAQLKTFIGISGSAAGTVILIGGYNVATNTPDVTQGNGILAGHAYGVTTGGTFGGRTLSPGDVMFAAADNPNSSQWFFQQGNLDDQANIAYGDFLPLSAGSGEALTGTLYSNGKISGPSYVQLEDNGQRVAMFLEASAFSPGVTSSMIRFDKNSVAIGNVNGNIIGKLGISTQALIVANLSNGSLPATPLALLDIRGTGKFSDKVEGRANQNTVAPTNTEFITKGYLGNEIDYRSKEMCVALGDETSDIKADTDVITFQMPNINGEITHVSVNVKTAPTGSTAIFDVNKNGSTILSTKISIDAGEKTSEDAATPPVLTTGRFFAPNDIITVDCDQIGSTVAGVAAKMWIYYKKNAI